MGPLNQSPWDQDPEPLAPDLKALWIAELKDPARKQCVFGFHKTDDSFDALGVLYDIAVDDDWVWTQYDWIPTERGYRKLSKIVDHRLRGKMIELNDVRKLSLPQIANWIQAHL